jgi:hypothetical protein
MAYTIALLRAAHRSATVRVTIRQGDETYSGIIVGIGSKLAIYSDGELIEDVPVERVVHADIKET